MSLKLNVSTFVEVPMQNSIISEVYKDDHIKLVVNSRMIELEVAKSG